jgi:dihydropteroate synthase
MHWRGHSDVMQTRTSYDGPGGVVAAVRAELGQRVDAARAAGIERLVVDPGLGFAKTADQNWELLRGLDVLAELGLPILVGASRKAFLGRLLAGPGGEPRPVAEREHAHSALVALLATRGIWGLRVHDVRATRDALAAVGRMDP